MMSGESTSTRLAMGSAASEAIWVMSGTFTS